MATKWHLGETRNYERFKFVESNRDINDNNVNKIEQSILEIGIQVPIVVNDNYEIIEGQHRFVALRRNKLVVPYIISTSASEKYIARLQESKKWNAVDFCRSLATKGNIDCQISLELAEEWQKHSKGKMKISSTIELLMDGKGYTGVLTKLKNNGYKVNIDCGKTVYDAIDLMSNLDMGTTPYGQKIMRTLKRMYYEFNGLNLDAIEHMTSNNYLKAYSAEGEQFEYMAAKYNKSLKALA
jgi:hypothetical protein